jgi:hypothetical protein
LTAGLAWDVLVKLQPNKVPGTAAGRKQIYNLYDNFFPLNLHPHYYLNAKKLVENIGGGIVDLYIYRRFIN